MSPCARLSALNFAFRISLFSVQDYLLLCTVINCILLGPMLRSVISLAFIRIHFPKAPGPHHQSAPVFRTLQEKWTQQEQSATLILLFILFIKWVITISILV